MNLCLLLTVAFSAAPAPHGGTLARTSRGYLELVAGPERLALYPLDPKLTPVKTDDLEALIVSPAGSEQSLERAGDHWEILRPPDAKVLVAVVRGPSGSSAARFDVTPGMGSLYHDHRPFHGGMVGMAGERHLELALSHGRGPGAELQLYLTDAYRQPVALAGIQGTLTVRAGNGSAAVPLTDGGDCFVAKIPSLRGTLDVHIALRYPTAPQIVEMDFFVEPSQAPTRAGRPVLVHVTSAGFSPNRIEAHAGEPLTLRFLRVTDQTCATRVVFPSEGIDRALPLERPVDVALVPRRGEVAFACGMGMLRGTVVAR
ncbi:MAG: cupredoxin domain-containing protein [Myxococcales bacterium]